MSEKFGDLSYTRRDGFEIWMTHSNAALNPYEVTSINPDGEVHWALYFATYEQAITEFNRWKD